MKPITYQKLNPADGALLTEQIELYAEVFEMENFRLPPRDYLQTLLHKEHVFFFVALAEGRVIGGLTAYVLPSVYFSASEVYIYDLAVATVYQRKGIGRQLLDELKHYCRQRGDREIFVQADLEDQHALDFYRATGGQPESVIHFTYALS